MIQANVCLNDVEETNECVGSFRIILVIVVNVVVRLNVFAHVGEHIFKHLHLLCIAHNATRSIPVREPKEY